jgi:hypothetical protein
MRRLYRLTKSRTVGRGRHILRRSAHSASSFRKLNRSVEFPRSLDLRKVTAFANVVDRLDHGNFALRMRACSGDTRQARVSTFMNNFRELGFISSNSHLEVHNSLLNVVLHDTPQIRPDAKAK